MPFRAYPSYTESFQDNAHVLKTTNFGTGPFYSKVWRANAATYQQATAALTGKYATDPNYGASLNRIIAQYNLTRFDNGATSGGNDTAATYTVKSGDTLWAISQRSGLSITQIQKLNHLSSTVLHIGQKLILSAQTSAAPPLNNTSAQNNSTTITVKSGDTLWAISIQYKTTVTQLKTWNHLTSDAIHIGQKLVVAQSNTPEKASAQSSPQEASSNVHQVVSGDTLWTLAQKSGSTVASIKAWNHLSSDAIFIGQYLRVK
jgi:LysM repeat protein